MTLLMTYKERLQADYERIRADTKAGKLPLPERLQQIEEVTERYTLAHAEDYARAIEAAIDAEVSPGLVPIPFRNDPHIEWLTDLVLHEDLTDNTPYKIQNTEYPFFSDRMLDKRSSRDVNINASDSEEERIMAGRRRKRSYYEERKVDEAAKSRNKEIRKKYNDFISGKTEGTIRIPII